MVAVTWIEPEVTDPDFDITLTQDNIDGEPLTADDIKNANLHGEDRPGPGLAADAPGPAADADADAPGPAADADADTVRKGRARGLLQQVFTRV